MECLINRYEEEVLIFLKYFSKKNPQITVRLLYSLRTFFIFFFEKTSMHFPNQNTTLAEI